MTSSFSRPSFVFWTLCFLQISPSLAEYTSNLLTDLDQLYSISTRQLSHRVASYRKCLKKSRHHGAGLAATFSVDYHGTRLGRTPTRFDTHGQTRKSKRYIKLAPTKISFHHQYARLFAFRIIKSEESDIGPRNQKRTKTSLRQSTISWVWRL
jgi:hypothetical protein